MNAAGKAAKNEEGKEGTEAMELNDDALESVAGGVTTLGGDLPTISMSGGSGGVTVSATPSLQEQFSPYVDPYVEQERIDSIMACEQQDHMGQYSSSDTIKQAVQETIKTSGMPNIHL